MRKFEHIENDVKLLYESGTSYKDIAKEFDITMNDVATILQYLNKNKGLIRRYKSSNKDKYIENIILLKDKGFTNRQIAEKLKICSSTVSNYLNFDDNKNEQLAEEVRELHLNGVKPKYIANKLNISPQLVRRYINLHKNSNIIKFKGGKELNFETKKIKIENYKIETHDKLPKSIHKKYILLKFDNFEVLTTEFKLESLHGKELELEFVNGRATI